MVLVNVVILSFLSPSFCMSTSNSIEATVDGTDYQGLLDSEMAITKQQKLSNSNSNPTPSNQGANQSNILSNTSQANIINAHNANTLLAVTNQSNIINTQKAAIILDANLLKSLCESFLIAPNLTQKTQLAVQINKILSAQEKKNVSLNLQQLVIVSQIEVRTR